MKKLALVIHGWPQPMAQDHILRKLFEKLDYDVMAPYLFEGDGEFGEESVFKKIDEELGEREPSVIAGVSMGGLIALQQALKHPKSKLILVATGVRINPNDGGFKLVWKAAGNRFGKKVMELIADVPDSVLIHFYRKINPFIGSEEQRGDYEEDLRGNVEYMKKIPIAKHVQIVNYLKVCDMREKCREIKNETLILSGEGDPIMPGKAGEELNRLLVNSKLVKVNNGHFNVLNTDSLRQVGKFL